MAITNFYKQATFELSSPDLMHSPADNGYEVAFAGRSNVGKSSTINAITSQKKLANISKTPGSTQHLVYFSLANNRRLVDLPGYGFAKATLMLKKSWQANMNAYFAERKSLVGLILVMDIRHPLTKFDRQMLNWSIKCKLKTHILLNKADKISKNQAINTQFAVARELKKFSKISLQIFSALKKQNLIQVHQALDKMLKI